MIFPDVYGMNEDGFFDIDIELSYFLKNYIIVKLRPNDYKKKKFDLKGLYYHRFNEEEDLEKRNFKHIRNQNDYLVRKGNNDKKVSKSEIIIFLENNLGENIKLKRNSLIRSKNRAKLELKKIR